MSRLRSKPLSLSRENNTEWEANVYNNIREKDIYTVRSKVTSQRRASVIFRAYAYKKSRGRELTKEVYVYANTTIIIRGRKERTFRGASRKRGVRKLCVCGRFRLNAATAAADINARNGCGCRKRISCQVRAGLMCCARSQWPFYIDARCGGPARARAPRVYKVTATQPRQPWDSLPFASLGWELSSLSLTCFSFFIRRYINIL